MFYLKKKDEKKNMGIYPAVWGPQQWALLHLMAELYPIEPSEKRQGQMKGFLDNLCPNLPCGGCALHCQEYMKEHPPDVSSRNNLFMYLVDFHNAVNTRLGKRVFSYKEAEEHLKKQFLNTKDWGVLARAVELRSEDNAWVQDLKSIEERRQLETKCLIAIVIFVLLVGIFLLLKKKKK